ncbi:MAG: hypothetical protein ABSD74_12215 [Rhizomicrobium sp.]|jgi:hypothetical protein
MPPTNKNDDQNTVTIAGFESDERVFHYTNAQGLYGILESGCLWATHFQFLNDSKEFYSAKRSLTKSVESALARHLAARKVNRQITITDGTSIRTLASEESQRFVDILYSALFGSEEHSVVGSDAFVFSTFRCSPSNEAFADGELLHWATYGRNGGYALQFAPQKLDALLVNERKKFVGLPYIFEPTFYSKEGEVPAGLKDAYGEVCNSATEMADYEVSQHRTVAPDYAVAGGAFMHIVSRTKDAFFKREAEARIVVFRSRVEQTGFRWHPFFIRHAAALPIPYIKLFEDQLFGEHLPIERIIIGPHPERERRQFVLREFLRQKKLLDKIQIAVSEVPYVNVSP